VVEPERARGHLAVGVHADPVQRERPDTAAYQAYGAGQRGALRRGEGPLGYPGGLVAGLLVVAFLSRSGDLDAEQVHDRPLVTRGQAAGRDFGETEVDQVEGGLFVAGAGVERLGGQMSAGPGTPRGPGAGLGDQGEELFRLAQTFPGQDVGGEAVDDV